jgi:hypothetical protein
MIDEQIFSQQLPAGEYQDRLIDSAGKVIWEVPWQSNLIVNGLRKLLAAAIKGDTQQGKPIAFWAVGTGDDSWDNGSSNLPTDDVRRGFTQLVKETGRKAIDSNQITFIDGTFTNRLQISTEFKIADIPGGATNWKLREFGIIGGDSSAAANSGILINHRIHSRIDLQDGFTLQRTLRLTF